MTKVLVRDTKRSRYKKHLKIYPKNVARYDLTHINSIGFHGDETFCIGFDSRLNQEDMNRFEEKVRTINNKQPIYWFTDIQLQEDYSAIWVPLFPWTEKSCSKKPSMIALISIGRLSGNVRWDNAGKLR